MASAARTRLPPSFNRLAWSNLAAQSAEQIAVAAAPIVTVVALGGGAGETGLIQTAQTLPFLLFAIPAGMLADRMSRRSVMAYAEALRVISLIAILALAEFGLLTWPLLALLGLIGACGTVAYSVAAPSLVPALVPSRALASANSRIELARTLAFAAGPALGGCARRMVRCSTRVRSCSCAVCLCSGSARWPERTAQAATSTPSSPRGHPRGGQVRLSSPAAAARLRDAILVQHRVLCSPGGIRSVRYPFTRPFCLCRGRHPRHLRYRHGRRRACRRPHHSIAALRHRRGDWPDCRARSRLGDGSHHLDTFGSARRAQLLSARSRSYRLGHRYYDAAPNGHATGFAWPRIGDQHHGVRSSADRRWNWRVHRGVVRDGSLPGRGRHRISRAGRRDPDLTGRPSCAPA